MTLRARMPPCLTGLPLVLTLILSLLPSSATHANPAVGRYSQLFVMPESHITPVLHLLRTAQHSIRLEVYLLTNRAIVAELQRARHRGVDVRVLLEQHPFRESRYAQLGYGLLTAGGVPVRWANEGAFTYTHEKAVTIDNNLAGIFTFNLTSSGLYRNREFGLLDTDTGDIRALAAIFDADWARRSAQYSNQSHLVVSPYNARQRFTTLIDGARHTLDIYAEEVNDSSIETHLVSARRRGVRVRLLTSSAGPGVDVLKNAGVAVRIVAHPYIHAKAIVADSTFLFLGSENISSTSLDRNREIGLLIHETTSTSLVTSTFARDWQNAADSSGTPTAEPARSVGTGAVRVSVSPDRVRRGQLVTVLASSAPDAQCSIRITYPDGYVSRAHSLAGSRAVPRGGLVRWSWHVGSHVTGRAGITVMCASGASRTEGSATFIIY